MSDLPKAMTVETHEMIVTRLERELEEARKQIEASDWAQRQLTASLEEAREAEKEAHERADYWTQEAVNFNAQAEEARQGKVLAEAEAQACQTALAEARQERDEGDQINRAWVRLHEARIGELEAALREIGTWESRHLDVPEPGYGAQIALEMRSIARRALQPTTGEKSLGIENEFAPGEEDE